MLVMTSGNIHDEPIVIDDDEARAKLADVADAFLGNNRRILTRFDDSVMRVIRAGSAGYAIQVIRRARGYAPLPIKFSTENAEGAEGEVATTGAEDAEDREGAAASTSNAGAEGDGAT